MRRAALWSGKRFSGASRPVITVTRRQEIALRLPSTLPNAVREGWWKDFRRAQSAFRLQVNTRMRPRTRARGLAIKGSVVYELSRRPHSEASCRADRFGPIRISLLQRGQRQTRVAQFSDRRI